MERKLTSQKVRAGGVYSFAGIRAAMMLNVVGAYRAKLLSTGAVRCLLAILEAREENEARRRSVRAKTGQVIPIAPTTKEQVSRIIGRSAAAGIRELKASGVISLRAGNE